MNTPIILLYLRRRLVLNLGAALHHYLCISGRKLWSQIYRSRHSSCFTLHYKLFSCTLKIGPEDTYNTPSYQKEAKRRPQSSQTTHPPLTAMFQKPIQQYHKQNQWRGAAWQVQLKVQMELLLGVYVVQIAIYLSYRHTHLAVILIQMEEINIHISKVISVGVPTETVRIIQFKHYNKIGHPMQVPSTLSASHSVVLCGLKRRVWLINEHGLLSWQPFLLVLIFFPVAQR